MNQKTFAAWLGLQHQRPASLPGLDSFGLKIPETFPHALMLFIPSKSTHNSPDPLWTHLTASSTVAGENHEEQTLLYWVPVGKNYTEHYFVCVQTQRGDQQKMNCMTFVKKVTFCDKLIENHHPTMHLLSALRSIFQLIVLVLQTTTYCSGSLSQV